MGKRKNIQKIKENLKKNNYIPTYLNKLRKKFFFLNDKKNYQSR